MMWTRILKQSLKDLLGGCTLEPWCATGILVLIAGLVHKEAISLPMALILLLLAIVSCYSAMCAFNFYDSRNLL